MSSFQHLTDTSEDTIVVDVIFTTHGGLSQQITAYNMRGLDSSSPHALQSRPMRTSDLTLTPDVSSLKLNMIMFDETGKCSLVAQKFREGLRAAAAIYEDKKTLFVPEMLETLNHLHTSSETYISESDGRVREHTGLFQMYGNLQSIPEKSYTARTPRLEPTFAVFSNNERLTERIVSDIINQSTDSLSLMQVIIATQGAIVTVAGRGKKVVINIIDMSCNDLEKRINTKIAQTPRGSVQYKRIGGKKTKRKGSRRRKTKRKKTKRRN
jgi:hypothetical protein